MYTHVLGTPVFGMHPHLLVYPSTWGCIPIYWGTPSIWGCIPICWGASPIYWGTPVFGDAQESQDYLVDHVLATLEDPDFQGLLVGDPQTTC